MLSIAVGPSADEEVDEILRRTGAQPSPLDDAEALIWMDSDPRSFPDRLPDSVRWVQLPSAGVEAWVSAGRLDAGRKWTTAAGAYSESVAEHAVTLLLSAVRRIPDCVRADRWARAEIDPAVGTLRGSLVAIVGAGGIGRTMISQLDAFGAGVIAVNLSGREVPGAVETIPADRIDEVWGRADHIVLAAPATAQTRHLVGARELGLMKSTAWLVNVGRGALIDTDALVAVLAAGGIGGAALDVTDPEPLPDGHPLWSEPRALITPHVANPRSLLRRELLRRIEDNVAAFVRGDELAGAFDPSRGY